MDVAAAGTRRSAVRVRAAVAAALFVCWTPGIDAQSRSVTPLFPQEIQENRAQIERAIGRGFDWLKQHQNPDGSYHSLRRSSRPIYPTALSSLAGLAFLASGSTPTRGPHAKNLQKITSYLLSKCARGGVPGLITDRDAWEERTMYCHAFALTYLAQIFGMEKDPERREEIRGVLGRGVELTVRSQTDLGGWGYTPNYYEDEGTLTVTQLQGLRSCRDAGIFVPRGVIDRGVSYIEASTLPTGSVRYMARGSRSHEERPGVTCAAVVALWSAGRYDEPLIRRITDYMNSHIAGSASGTWLRGHHGEYVIYYLSQAKHVLGGEQWREYYRTISTMLIAEQEFDGGWTAGRDAGRFGNTLASAIALIVLQLPYNRLAVYQR